MALINSQLKNYRCFISHAWKYNDSYYKLVNMLNEAPRFKWSNHSVPKHDSLDTTSNKELEKELREQIAGTNIVIIISGMYYGHSKWILKEIEIAENMNKPIIAIKPRGQQKTPSEIKVKANELIGWNTYSIVSAIRKHSI
ncbi:TIR domain-containing protein [Salsuginibacillus kocurii]|uniref:TIR domain-containing protein n=1 Tax=Salsuginibacillus kocurii TaxID=427078 RepID=UPI00037C6821|nr:TIR domain-containing protein [Salsuginibacillus kocurii]